MSTSELGEPSRDEKRRSGVTDRRSAEAPFSDLINRWLAEGDRISEVARTVAAQPKERQLLELLRDLRTKADRHRFVVVFGAIALSAIAVIAMRAFSHAVLRTDSIVAARTLRPAPAVIVATAQRALAASAPAPSAPSADPLAPSADPPAPAAAAPAPSAAAPAPSAAAPAPSADPPAPAAAAPAPSADPPAPAAAAPAPSADPPAPAADPPIAVGAPVAPAADPPASPPPAPAPIAATPPPGATTAAAAQPESAATASEPEPTVKAAPAADPPVSEHPPLPVTARPAPAPRRPPLADKTDKTDKKAPVNTRTPLEACQSAIRWERAQDALISCDKLTRESPKSADAVVMLAHANLLAGRDGETLRLARRASAIDPKCAEAYLLIGNVEQAAGRMPGARTAYEAYLHAAPRGAHAAEVRAILKSQL